MNCVCLRPEVNRTPKKIDTLSMSANADKTGMFRHVEFIVKTVTFDNVTQQIVDIIVKPVVFG